jgi:hypothetical protein
VDNFLIGIENDSVSGCYMACFANGESIVLMATNFHDAVLEADQLTKCNYELGYN